MTAQLEIGVQTRLIPDAQRAPEKIMGLSERVIDQFRAEIGLPNSPKFDITNNGVRVIYTETPKTEKGPATRSLSASIGKDYATARVSSDGAEFIDWAHHDQEIMHAKDSAEAETNMQKMLSKFAPKLQEQPSA